MPLSDDQIKETITALHAAHDTVNSASQALATIETGLTSQLTPPAPTPPVVAPPTPAPPVTPPVVTPPAPAAGFLGLVVPDPKLWKSVHRDDFPTPCAEGDFLKTYLQWGAYPTSYLSTDKKGYYDPGRISVVKNPDGTTYMNCRIVGAKQNANGKASGCAPYQRFTQLGENDATAVDGLAQQVRVRCADGVAGVHQANLLWPKDEKWPLNGEIDWMEDDPTGTIGMFLHLEGALSGADQIVFKTNVTLKDWHVVGFEWLKGRSFKVFLDGKQLAPANAPKNLLAPDGMTVTGRVPSTPMRNVFQIETLGAGPASAVNFQYDWSASYIPVAS